MCISVIFLDMYFTMLKSIFFCLLTLTEILLFSKLECSIKLMYAFEKCD